MRIYDRVFLSAYLQLHGESDRPLGERAKDLVNSWSNDELLANIAAALQQELAKYSLDDSYREE